MMRKNNTLPQTKPSIRFHEITPLHYPYNINHCLAFKAPRFFTLFYLLISAAENNASKLLKTLIYNDNLLLYP